MQGVSDPASSSPLPPTQTQDVVQQWQEMLKMNHAQRNQTADGSQLLLGDFIFFENSDSAAEGGFLHGEGLISMNVGLRRMDQEESFVRAPPKLVRDCQFRVCPPLQYEAQKMLKKMTKRQHGHGQSTVMLRFQERAQSEEERNAYLLAHNSLSDKDKTCAPISYGDVIQLQHVTTRAFLKAKQFTAVNQKDALHLRLEREGDEFAHFKVLPRFHYHQEGDPVYFGHRCVPPLVCEAIQVLMTVLLRSTAHCCLSHTYTLATHPTFATLAAHALCLLHLLRLLLMLHAVPLGTQRANHTASCLNQ
jgi:hypothetical protein